MSKLSDAFREVNTNIPKNVIKSGKKGKAKRKMLAAIAYSKARRSGSKLKQALSSTPSAYGNELPITGSGT